MVSMSIRVPSSVNPQDGMASVFELPPVTTHYLIISSRSALCGRDRRFSGVNDALRFLFREEDLISYPHGEENRFTCYDQVVVFIYGQMKQSGKTSYGK